MIEKESIKNITVISTLIYKINVNTNGSLYSITICMVLFR